MSRSAYQNATDPTLRALATLHLNKRHAGNRAAIEQAARGLRTDHDLVQFLNQVSPAEIAQMKHGLLRLAEEHGDDINLRVPGASWRLGFTSKRRKATSASGSAAAADPRTAQLQRQLQQAQVDLAQARQAVSNAERARQATEAAERRVRHSASATVLPIDTGVDEATYRRLQSDLAQAEAHLRRIRGERKDLQDDLARIRRERSGLKDENTRLRAQVTSNSAAGPTAAASVALGPPPPGSGRGTAPHGYTGPGDAALEAEVQRLRQEAADVPRRIQEAQEAAADAKARELAEDITRQLEAKVKATDAEWERALGGEGAPKNPCEVGDYLQQQAAEKAEAIRAEKAAAQTEGKGLRDRQWQRAFVDSRRPTPTSPGEVDGYIRALKDRYVTGQADAVEAAKQAAIEARDEAWRLHMQEQIKQAVGKRDDNWVSMFPPEVTDYDGANRHYTHLGQDALRLRAENIKWKEAFTPRASTADPNIHGHVEATGYVQQLRDEADALRGQVAALQSSAGDQAAAASEAARLHSDLRQAQQGIAAEVRKLEDVREKLAEPWGGTSRVGDDTAADLAEALVDERAEVQAAKEAAEEATAEARRRIATLEASSAGDTTEAARQLAEEQAKLAATRTELAKAWGSDDISGRTAESLAKSLVGDRSNILRDKRKAEQAVETLIGEAQAAQATLADTLPAASRREISDITSASAAAKGHIETLGRELASLRAGAEATSGTATNLARVRRELADTRSKLAKAWTAASNIEETSTKDLAQSLVDAYQAADDKLHRFKGVFDDGASSAATEVTPDSAQARIRALERDAHTAEARAAEIQRAIDEFGKYYELAPSTTYQADYLAKQLVEGAQVTDAELERLKAIFRRGGGPASSGDDVTADAIERQVRALREDAEAKTRTLATVQAKLSQPYDGLSASTQLTDLANVVADDVRELRSLKAARSSSRAAVSQAKLERAQAEATRASKQVRALQEQVADAEQKLREVIDPTGGTRTDLPGKQLPALLDELMGDYAEQLERQVAIEGALGIASDAAADSTMTLVRQHKAAAETLAQVQEQLTAVAERISEVRATASEGTAAQLAALIKSYDDLSRLYDQQERITGRYQALLRQHELLPRSGSATAAAAEGTHPTIVSEMVLAAAEPHAQGRRATRRSTSPSSDGSARNAGKEAASAPREAARAAAEEAAVQEAKAREYANYVERIRAGDYNFDGPEIDWTSYARAYRSFFYSALKTKEAFQRTAKPQDQARIDEYLGHYIRRHGIPDSIAGDSWPPEVVDAIEAARKGYAGARGRGPTSHSAASRSMGSGGDSRRPSSAWGGTGVPSQVGDSRHAASTHRRPPAPSVTSEGGVDTISIDLSNWPVDTGSKTRRARTGGHGSRKAKGSSHGAGERRVAAVDTVRAGGHEAHKVTDDGFRIIGIHYFHRLDTTTINPTQFRSRFVNPVFEMLYNRGRKDSRVPHTGTGIRDLRSQYQHKYGTYVDQQGYELMNTKELKLSAINEWFDLEAFQQAHGGGIIDSQHLKGIEEAANEFFRSGVQSWGDRARAGMIGPMNPRNFFRADFFTNNFSEVGKGIYTSARR